MSELSAERVEIRYGHISWATVQDENGTRPDYRTIGKSIFLVDVIIDGSGCIMWDGESYEEAIKVAEELSADFGVHVVDCVVEGGHG